MSGRSMIVEIFFIVLALGIQSHDAASSTKSTTISTTTTTAIAVNASSTPTVCEDNADSECWSRPVDNCFGVYEAWSKTHCPLRCGFCPGKSPPCEDTLTYCAQFSPETCFKEDYQKWARENCRKHCNLCEVPIRPEKIPGFYMSSPPDGQVIYACAGETVSLLWKYILGVDQLGDIQWFHNGQMIAVRSHDVFLRPPTSANMSLDFRVNAGIVISKVTKEQSGNYSVKIPVFKHGQSYTILERVVYLQISDDLLAENNVLKVTQNPEAVFNPRANQWAIQLQCGTFTFLDAPPYQVEWVTSSGAVVNSTNYEDNRFQLLLENPIRGGKYVCRIPSHFRQAACLRDNVTQASITIDKVDARFSLLEKESETLKQSNLALTQSNQALKQSNQALKQSTAGLLSRLQNLESRPAPASVAFHAVHLEDTILTVNETLVANRTLVNRGGAYNTTSGVFTAPLAGVYFFAGTMLRPTSTSSVLSLMVDDQVVSQMDTRYYGTSVVQGLVSLVPNQRVWWMAGGPNTLTLNVDSTTFVGFLLDTDNA